MSDYIVMRAVEFSKLPATFKKIFKNEKGLVEAGYWMQKKYDGCMGIAMIRGDGTSQMLSRTGEDYTKSCEHIIEALLDAKADTWDGDGQCWDDFIVIGEVWQPISEAAFPEISGKFRRQSPSPELRFVANDLLPAGFNTDKPYSKRFQELCELVDHNGTAEVRVATTLFDTCDNPMAQALEWQGEGGFDGGILRNPDAGYTVGIVKNGEIVKIKPTLSLDLRSDLRGWEYGEKTGRKVWTISVTYRGVKTSVGSGVPHDEADVPANGSIVEIECLGITADGRLREPRFRGIRHDKVAPDA